MSGALLSHFEDFPDPRVDRTKCYPLIEIVFLIIAGTLCGFEGWKQIKYFGEMKLDWLRKFLLYASGIPMDDTLARVMRKLDTNVKGNLKVIQFLLKRQLNFDLQLHL